MGQYVMIFATNLKRLRKRAGLTQERLADACGYPGQSRVGNYESGIREPELSEIPTIAKALGAEIAELFTGPASALAGSQLVRLEPNRIAETAKALRIHFKRQGVVYNIEDDPATFVLAYGWRQELGDSRDSQIELQSRLFDLTPQGTLNGRSEGVPDAGTATGKARR